MRPGQGVEILLHSLARTTARKPHAQPVRLPTRPVVEKRTNVRSGSCTGYAPTLPALFQHERSLREAAEWLLENHCDQVAGRTLARLVHGDDMVLDVDALGLIGQHGHGLETEFQLLPLCLAAGAAQDAIG